MTISKVPITGSVVLPDGSTLSGGTLVFTLSRADYEGGDAIVGAEVTATLGAGGAIPTGTQLWRNSVGGNATWYDVTVRGQVAIGTGQSLQRSYPLGQIIVGAASTYALGDLLEAVIQDPTEPAPAYVSDFARTVLAGATADAMRTTMGLPPLYLSDFGVVGAVRTNLATDNGPPTGATVDETTALQAAFDAALAAGRDLIGDPARVYGITGPLVWGLRNNSLSIKGEPVLIDVALQCIGGTWAAGNLSNADPTLWTFGPAALTVGKAAGFTGSGKPRVSVLGVTVNAARIAPVGIQFRGVTQSNHDAGSYRAREAVYLIGGAPGGDDSLNCTDSRFSLRGSEFQYTSDLADGYNDWTVRTAVGLMVQSADVSFHQVTIAPSKYGIILGDSFNVQLTNCKFWNGPARTNPNSRTLWVTKSAHNWVFSACRFDDGHLYLQSFDGKFSACEQIQYSQSNAVTLEASVAGETAQDFIAEGNVFQSTQANLTTSGSGSWGTFRGKVGHNKNTNDGFFTFAGVADNLGDTKVLGDLTVTGDVVMTPSGDNATIKSSKRLVLMGDYDANSGGSQSGLGIGSDGVEFFDFQEAGNARIGSGRASGGGPIANLSWNLDTFRFSPTNSGGTGTDFNRRWEHVPGKGYDFYGDLKVIGGDHGLIAGQFTTRAALASWWATAVAGGMSLSDGILFSANGVFWRTKAGSTAISDLLGLEPHGTVAPEHFGYAATPGTSDMRAAILAAATYISGLGGGVVDAVAWAYAVSAPIDISALSGVRFRNLNFIATGTWTANDPIFLLSKASAARVDITFQGCNFEGSQQASGVSVTNCSRVVLLDCKGHGLKYYAVRSRTSAGELFVIGCNFRQYYNGETGWAVEANRTAILLDIQTPDAIITGTVAAYCLVPVVLDGPFNNIQMSHCHFYNDGFTPGSGQPYSAKINARDLKLFDNYFDNGLVRIDSRCTGNFSRNHAAKTGTGVNTAGFEFFNAGADPDMTGLIFDGNTANGFVDYTSPIIFTGTFNTNLKLTIGTPNTYSTGKPFSGIPTIWPGDGDYRLQDDIFFLFNAATPTKIARFGLGSVPVGESTYFLPNTPGTLMCTAASATISGTMTFTTAPKWRTGTPVGIEGGQSLGGTVAQATSRTTAVTINKVSGQITLVAGAGSATGERFTVNNTLVTANAQIKLNLLKGMTNLYLYQAEVAPAGGSFDIVIVKISGAASESPVLQFTIDQGAKD